MLIPLNNDNNNKPNDLKRVKKIFVFEYFCRKKHIFTRFLLPSINLGVEIKRLININVLIK